MVKEIFFKKIAQNVECIAYKASTMKCMGYFYEPKKPKILIKKWIK